MLFEGANFEEMPHKNEEAEEADGQYDLKDRSEDSPLVQNEVFVGKCRELTHYGNL